MRIFKISQSIIFQEDSAYGLFKEGQQIILSGYLKYQTDDQIVMGYLKQKPIDCDSLVLYVKGYWDKNSETDTGKLILVETTRNTDTICFSPITICCYFPNNIKGTTDGYADETTGIPSMKEQYFFIDGNYIATTNIIMEEMSVLTECYEANLEYSKAEQKLNRMINKLYVFKNQYKLNFGFLFDFIQPNWLGADRKLIDTYPDK